MIGFAADHTADISRCCSINDGSPEIEEDARSTILEGVACQERTGVTVLRTAIYVEGREGHKTHELRA